MKEFDNPGDRWVYETCRRCERRCTITFWVDDETWTAVSESYDRLCPTCFDEMADQKSVAYTFRAVNVISWSQGYHGDWPHLDVPCAECTGREQRRQIWADRMTGRRG